MLPKTFIYYNLFATVSFLTFSAIFVLFYWMFSKKNYDKTANIVLVLLSFALALSFSHSMFYGDVSSGYSSTIFNNLLTAFSVSLALISVISSKDMMREKIKYGEYYFLLFTSLIGSVLLINTQNLLNIFISIELISMSLYGIIGLTKRNENIESSLKYFILGSFASVFMIIGLFFIYIQTESVNLSAITKFYHLNPNSDLINISLMFFLAGVLFKLAIVPAHSWSLDVYCGAETNVVILMVGFVKLSVITAVYKIFSSYSSFAISKAFYVFIIMTAVIPNLSALFTQNIKKIMIYSSISHAGYITLSFMGPEKWQAYFYALVYSISAVGIFSAVSFLEKNYKNIEYSNIKGLYHKNPGVALSLSVFLFSFAGVPPLSGFFAKFYSFYNAAIGGYKDLVLISALASAISLYYYLKILIPIFFSKPEEETTLEFSRNNIAIIYFTAIITVLMGIFSNPIIELIKKTI